MYELGRAYDPGKGTGRSQRRAEQWYGRAAAEGHVEAMAAGQELSGGQKKLSRSERRRLEKKRAEDRARRESEHSRKMMQVGRCEVYGSGGPRSEMRVEMRTRMDCLNRGGSFETADRDARGSFSTMDDGRSWDSRRRELNRLRTAERRRSRESGFSSGDLQPLETDWVVCYARGSRRSNGRAGNSCSSAMRKTRDRTTSWCRDRGYDSRRLFKHESSARSWISENCR